MEGYIERRICIAAIVSTEFWQKLDTIWKPELIGNAPLSRTITWTREYFHKYGKAPGKDIQSIYLQNSKKLSEDDKEWIEELLESLSEEWEGKETENIQPLIDETIQYLKERGLSLLVEEMQGALDKGQVSNAEDLLTQYSPVKIEITRTDLDPFSKESESIIKSSFSERKEVLIKFPKALGEFWNQEMVRGGFVALMGAEKKGKTMMLLEIAMRAHKTGSAVAFFQAGDMTEAQQLRRMAIYVARKSDEERYCKGMWIPEVDCLENQLDTCNKDCRETSTDKAFKSEKEINFETLINTSRKYPEHVCCYNCKEITGSPWLKWQPGKQPLTSQEAYKVLRKWGKKAKGAFRLSTYPNDSLSMSMIVQKLKQWHTESGFQPDVLIIDYADLLVPDNSKIDFRHQQNRIWQQMRQLSQKLNLLLITVTQISTSGYSKDLLSLSDFSEDKRKHAHVTAMYGLNQTSDEKRIGIMRINELVVREADFDDKKPVYLLQRLQMGRAYLGSWR